MGLWGVGKLEEAGGCYELWGYWVRSDVLDVYVIKYTMGQIEGSEQVVRKQDYRVSVGLENIRMLMLRENSVTRGSDNEELGGVAVSKVGDSEGVKSQTVYRRGGVAMAVTYWEVGRGVRLAEGTQLAELGFREAMGTVTRFLVPVEVANKVERRVRRLFQF